MGMGQTVDYSQFILQIEKAIANGVASLDSNAKVPKNQIDLIASDVGAIATETDPTVSTFTKGLTNNNSILTALNAASGTISASILPSYVDDFLTFSTFENFPATGETGKIYLAENTNLSYRWTGVSYVDISSVGISDAALKLNTPRTIGITGDGSYSVSFDGSANASSNLTLATVNSNTGNFGNANTIPSVTVNGKGLITAVSTNSIGNELIALQALADTAGFLKKTGDGTYSIDASNYQPLDSDLTAIAALAQSNKSVIFSNGTTWTAKQIDLSTDVTGVLKVANGGTNINTYTDGQILFGNGTTNINASSKLYWDNVNKYLGIGVGTPAHPLDVFGSARVSGQSLFTNTTESSSTITGGSVFSGGIGIAGNIFCGGTINGNGAGITNVVLSIPTGITGASAITNAVVISRANYNSITPNATTLYLILE